MHAPLLIVIQNCESMCEYMVTFFGEDDDCELRKKQIRLLRDCADACTLAAKYIARHSLFSKYSADFVAFICDKCAKECEKFGDRESQNCAEMCLKCAKECKDYSMIL
ncbi:four-helix bundle copper-binding protein [Oceanirhabdus sp. W0125-5]|uniref:four-helix bundle copper-binding protein n=1 Tax=Oceanirhabdus sp. W0125-5 TaxID=2999116 RepID=UPI0022F30AEB|nr:four-helix bundle copper-binding protein [Oceanirhabdus sp. W0125-5]WBW95028.1 four-helix bundle copper-binding protein [Oceanirhabdus sp. W0125-5]